MPRNVDNGGSAGLAEGSNVLEQRLQAIEAGIASIQATLSIDVEASAKMPSNRESEPHKPHAASIRKQHLSGIDSSPKIADNGTPGLGQATNDTGELKATSHSCQMSRFESSLSVLANSSQMQPRVECNQDCPLRAPCILIFFVHIVARLHWPF